MTSRNGLLLVDKESGLTSHDVIARLRRLLDERRIGHAGTLDPLATGLLVVAVGPATRLLRFAQAETKRYVGVVRLGVATASLDADGEVTATAPVPTLTPDQVTAVTTTFVGTISQMPPMVSAVKVGGRRLHAIARAGGEVERTPREIHVSQFTMSPTSRVDEWGFAVTCSTGTYVRVLLADAAASLGTLGHLTALRRESSGRLHVANARRLDEIATVLETGGDPLLSPSELVSSLTSVRADDDIVTAVRHGQRVSLRVDPEITEVALCRNDGTLVGVLIRRGDHFKPDVVLDALH